MFALQPHQVRLLPDRLTEDHRTGPLLRAAAELRGNNTLRDSTFSRIEHTPWPARVTQNHYSEGDYRWGYSGWIIIGVYERDSSLVEDRNLFYVLSPAVYHGQFVITSLRVASVSVMYFKVWYRLTSQWLNSQLALCTGLWISRCTSTILWKANGSWSPQRQEIFVTRCW